MSNATGIFDEFQGKGLGTILVKHILEQKDLQVRLWFLATKSAHGLYEKLGFSTVTDPERLMFKREEKYC
ncbi:MAG: GNAT family N-acetyltransferase [Gammaproteobacteria bacterium]|nr:GNAT family N-acetyltransferase [Gammaproteobacteria bacterium]